MLKELQKKLENIDVIDIINMSPYKTAKCLKRW